MRALPVVLLLALASPALAQSPGPEGPAAPAAPAAPAEPPAAEAPAEAPAQAAEGAQAVEAEEPPQRVKIAPPSTIAPVGGEPARTDSEPELRTYRYRFQVIGADAAVIATSFLVAGLSQNQDGRPGGLATLTIASYFFAAPMIHGLHRQGKRALASFGLRAGLPLLLGLLGEQIDNPPPCPTCEDTLRSQGQIIGLTVGVLVAMGVDATLLSRPISQRSERRPRAGWAPSIRGVRGGALAGVGGWF